MKRQRLIPLVIFAVSFFCASCSRQSSGGTEAATTPQTSASKLEVTKVLSQKLNTTVRLPAQLMPYEVVDVYAKETVFVKWIKVDRGSRVKEGELIAQLEAPELLAQRAQADSAYESALSQVAAVEAKLAAD